MIIFDTDTFTLYVNGNELIRRRIQQAVVNDEIVVTIITRIEVLRGRFEAILKAADATQLQQAMTRLELSETALSAFRTIPIDTGAANEFDKLRQNKKLKKIGRGDLLIASITLAHKAKLITRNVRHFQQVSGLQIENWAD